jgi:hypothetical protein
MVIMLEERAESDSAAMDGPLRATAGKIERDLASARAASSDGNRNVTWATGT